MLFWSAKFIQLCIILLLFNGSFVCSLDKLSSDEYKLFNKLFQNYSSSIRPIKNWNDTLNVKLVMSLLKIADVAENYQSMTLHVRLQMVWNDEYLNWNANEFNNLKSIVLPASNVWVPDLHLFNSASNENHLVPTNIELYSNGTISTFPLSYLSSHCDFDFTRFPYDTQQCSFVIGTMIDRSKVRLNIISNSDSRKLFSNPEWIFRKASASEEILSFTDKSDWSSVKFTVEVRRNSRFYVNLFIWPSIFILFIIMSIFILPPTCVERVVMGVMTLLSLILMLLMLESYMPRNSFTGWPIIGKLILFDMFMATISIYLSTLITGFNRDNFFVKVIPSWLKNLTINWLAKIACKKETVHAYFIANQNHREDEIEVIDANQVHQHQIGEGQTNEMTQIQTLIVLINNQLAMLRMRLREKDIREQNKKEWFLIASILDRVCLIFYVFIMLFGLIIVFA